MALSAGIGLYLVFVSVLLLVSSMGTPHGIHRDSRRWLMTATFLAGKGFPSTSLNRVRMALAVTAGFGPDCITGCATQASFTVQAPAALMAFLVRLH